MLASSSTQLSAADISERENSRVTNGPDATAARAEAAPARGACDGPLAAAPAGTSATAAATVTALSRPARLLPVRWASPVMVTTFLDEFLIAVAVATARRHAAKRPFGSACPMPRTGA